MAFIGKSALATGSTTVTPSYGGAHKDNVLVALVTSHSTGATSISGSTAGWTRRESVLATTDVAEIWDKTAVGSDSMPTWHFTGSSSAVIIAEFSSTTTFDKGGTKTGAASPLTVTATAKDGGTGRLLITVGAWRFGTADSFQSLGHNFNSGTGTFQSTIGSDTGLPQASHHYSIYCTNATTGSVADTDAVSWTSTSGGSANHVALAMASYYLNVQQNLSRNPSQSVGPATVSVTRGITYTRGVAETLAAVDSVVGVHGHTGVAVTVTEMVGPAFDSPGSNPTVYGVAQYGSATYGQSAARGSVAFHRSPIEAVVTVDSVVGISSNIHTLVRGITETAPQIYDVVVGIYIAGGRVITEIVGGLGAVDSVSRSVFSHGSVPYVQAVTESLPPSTDSPLGVFHGTYTRNPAETVGAALDSVIAAVSQAHAYSRGLTETLPVALDGLARALSFARGPFETTIATDSIIGIVTTPGARIVRSVQETLGPAVDATLGRLLALVRGAVEIGTAAVDSVTGQVTQAHAYSRGIPETTAVVADTWARTVARTRAITDSAVAVTDTVVGIPRFKRLIAETVIYTEAISRSLVQSRNDLEDLNAAFDFVNPEPPEGFGTPTKVLIPSGRDLVAVAGGRAMSKK